MIKVIPIPVSVKKAISKNLQLAQLELDNERLKRFAAKHKPPQELFDEDMAGLYGGNVMDWLINFPFKGRHFVNGAIVFVVMLGLCVGGGLVAASVTLAWR